MLGALGDAHLQQAVGACVDFVGTVLLMFRNLIIVNELSAAKTEEFALEFELGKDILNCSMDFHE